ncbi:MAG TPA: radical SAM protein, partial [Bacteroidales bacterium]|nr:radical SAM protein [Bacteroidales bacterium]
MNILLITPPLTQLNTPYPATAYLKGFLVKNGYNVHQCDLGIELVNRLFTRHALGELFSRQFERDLTKFPKSVQHTLANKHKYLNSIDAVIAFLRGNDPTLATRICNTDFLPRGKRFNDITDIEWAFGALGFTDQAKYLCTLYIEDLTDLIRETECPYFELNRYAEKLSLYMPHFDNMEKALNASTNIVDELMLSILDEKIQSCKADFIGFSVPFPGNLYGALKCGQYIKKTYPSCTLAMGGGYVNTELRGLSEERVFKYIDYILLDDGEPAILKLLQYIEGNADIEELVNTFAIDNTNNITFYQSKLQCCIAPEDKGTPDYSDLPINKYLSMIEIANPMHKLWSDGQWNKLTLAQGCYWAKCAFCDTTLPYIGEY